MQRVMLKSKIHRATVTGADKNYEGSLGIDEALLEAADILPGERVDVYNIDSGDRFSTYAIREERRSGRICLNGAAARLGEVGDKVIIATYASFDGAELGSYSPRIVHVDDANLVQRDRRFISQQGRAR
jgi:aspartate 1-decarboxylase